MKLINIRSRWGAPLGLLATAAVVTGCGGGGGFRRPTSQNAAPIVSAFRGADGQPGHVDAGAGVHGQ